MYNWRLYITLPVFISNNTHTYIYTRGASVRAESFTLRERLKSVSVKRESARAFRKNDPIVSYVSFCAYPVSPS